MTIITVVARPDVAVCVCGATLVPALRYGPAPTPLPVLVCWECAAERPPLACCRSGETAVRTHCAQCGCPLTRRQRSDQQRFCGLRCYGQSKVVERLTITCPCGVRFRQHKTNQSSIYCSRRCFDRFRGKAWQGWREKVRRTA